MHGGNRKNPQNMGKIIQPNTIHATGIFTYIWLIFMVNVGKYTIHGWYIWTTKQWINTSCYPNWQKKCLVSYIVYTYNLHIYIYSSFPKFAKRLRTWSWFESGELPGAADWKSPKTLGNLCLVPGVEVLQDHIGNLFPRRNWIFWAKINKNTLTGGMSGGNSWNQQ